MVWFSMGCIQFKGTVKSQGHNFIEPDSITILKGTRKERMAGITNNHFHANYKELNSLYLNKIKASMSHNALQNFECFFIDN